MTKEDWKQLEEKYGLFSPLKLVCDGYNITLQKSMNAKQTKLINAVFVNNQFKGVWLDKKNGFPESKFMYEAKKVYRNHSEKDLKKLRKLFGKEKSIIFEPVRICYLVPFFPSFSAFKKTMIKNCKSIEIGL